MNRLTPLMTSERSLAPLLARVALGAVVLPHGLQKTVGWFGGYGFTGTMDYFTETLGIPWIFAFAAVVSESVGALCLLAGIATRLWAVLVGTTLFVAMWTSHLEHGFFMNWFGAQAGEGIEFFLLALGLALSLAVSGGGRFALDRALAPVTAR